MKWILFVIAGFMGTCIMARGDEFDARVAKFEAATAKMSKADPFKAPTKRATTCRCGGDPLLCTCAECECAGGADCRTQVARVWACGPNGCQLVPAAPYAASYAQEGPSAGIVEGRQPVRRILGRVFSGRLRGGRGGCGAGGCN